MTDILRPSIRYNGRQYNGDPLGNHPDLMQKHNIPRDGNMQRGFVTPNGQFLTRREAKLWLKSKSPDIYKKWKDFAGSDDADFHSEDLADALTYKEVDLSKKTAVVYDLGIFPEEAVRLARDFGKVWYATPWESAFPEPFEIKIGEGLEGVERIKAIEDKMDEADVIWLPDTLCASKTKWLKKHGYHAGGAGESELLELKRFKSRMMQKERGLPCQDTWEVVGCSNLSKLTHEQKNCVVKLDAIRGLEETWEYTDWKDAEQTISDLASKLGPYKEKQKFTVEEKLKGIEPGLDYQQFDGELLYPVMVGYEGKSVGIIERTYWNRKETPDAALWTFDAFENDFRKWKTRMFGSFEFIIGEDKLPYIIDPCKRKAAPGVAAIQSEGQLNYSQVVYGMCAGIRVRPIMKKKYSAAAAMESSSAGKTWVNISFPKELRQYIKLRMAVRVDGEYFAVPGLDSVATVIGFGDTVDEALKEVGERADQVHGKRLSKGVKELHELKEKIEEGIKFGINF